MSYLYAHIPQRQRAEKLRLRCVWWRSDVESREKECARFVRNGRDGHHGQIENSRTAEKEEEEEL